MLEAIRNLDCSSEFNGSNFRPVEYQDSKGETRPSVDMTRDGLSYLIMGFKGLKALKFKLAYITAFNKMEAELRARLTFQPMLSKTYMASIVSTTST